MPRPFHPAIHRRARGSELVEFAAVLPGLVLLMLMVGEGAGMIRAHNILLNAAREGARLSVVPGESGRTAEIQQRVIDDAAAGGVSLSAANVTVNQAVIISPNGGGCGASNPCMDASEVSVSYSYPLSFLSNLPFGLPATVPLGAAVEMRNFY